MKFAAEVFRWVATVACWGVFAVVLYRRWNWRFPIFTVYLLTLAVYLTVWSPPPGGLPVSANRQWLTMEPIMLGLRLLSMVELFWLISHYITRKEAVLLLGLLSTLAGALVWRAWGLYPFDSWMEGVRDVRTLATLGMASMLGFGALLFWIEPLRVPYWLRNHALALCLYLLLKLGIEVVPRSQWWFANALFFAGLVGLLALWALGQRNRLVIQR